MQLVALHVATSTALPDTLLGMTGEERAVTLLRESWTNCPLSSDENLALDNIKELAHGRSPTVSLLCDNIELSSMQFNFLHPNTCVNRGYNMNNSYEASAYLNNVKSNKISSRCYLTSREEEQVIGLRSSKPTLPPCFEPNQRLLPSPVGPDEIKSVQRRLDKIRSDGLSKSGKPKVNDPRFPLGTTHSSTLERDMFHELKESWDAHMQVPSHVHDPSLNGHKNALVGIQKDVVEMRRKVEVFLLEVLNQEAVHQSAHWHDSAQKMLRLAGQIPTAIVADLAKIAVAPTMIATFNPMIKDNAQLLGSISIWLQLCVYEDKMARILSFFDMGSLEEVMTEIGVETVWDSCMHPYWLVFEVENEIQIRQEQYKVAQHLIDNPGNVIQLNMGLGKVSLCCY